MLNGYIAKNDFPLKVGEEQKEEQKKMLSTERNKKLEAILKLILHLHFSNAMTFQMIDEDLFKKNFARFTDKGIIDALTIFITRTTPEKAKKELKGIDIFDILNITEKEKERYYKKCKKEHK